MFLPVKQIYGNMIHICLAVCLSFYIYLHGASNLFDRGDNLEEKDFGEADRLFWIYTEKFGMIMASAKGVRLEKSKLRGNLDIFTYGDFAVISSKDFWESGGCDRNGFAETELRFGGMS